MSRLTALFTIALLSVSGTAFPEAEADFNNAVCSLGLFSSSDSIRKVGIVLCNTGDTPLVISGAETMCSCTSVSFSEKCIEAGDSAVIVVTYNAADKWPGIVSQTARIRSNAANSPIDIRITGFMYDSSTVPDSTTVADWPSTGTPLVTKTLRKKD